MVKPDYMKFLRTETFPTPFCPGCGHGILMGAIARCATEMELDPLRLLFVSGIGCAAWIPSPHFATDTLHTTHGRAIAFATGAKLFKPALKVVVVSGDGDLSAIGGNHLIHAARRNIEMTVLCANNSIYGMTGGQAGPTTPTGARTATTPEGNPERPFDLCRLVYGAGATYVARSTVYHVRHLMKVIKNALSHKGFAFVDVVSPCFTQFGRKNKVASASDQLFGLKEACATVDGLAGLAEDRQADKIAIGEFTARKE
ncbi:MAG: thiamine pyrophosphate-dependent enzyme [Planctomycetota bacterium]|nr:thiamine pyrophosphate-dependent enzyme [Planctomycetota bacterium]